MPAQVNFCHALLVGTSLTVPSKASDYNYSLRQPAVGCNAVFCYQCGCRVRRYHGTWMEAGQPDRRAMYFFTGEGLPPLLKPDKEMSTYVCPCSDRSVSGAVALAFLEETQGYAWVCDGHPTDNEERVVNGVEVTALTDLDRLVLGPLEADPPGEPLVKLRDLYGAFRGTLTGERIEKLARRMLTHRTSQTARMLALGLYWLYPDIAPVEELRAFARERDLWFRDKSDPGPVFGPTLEHRLLGTLGKLWLQAPDDELRVLFRARVDEGFVSALLPVLLEGDREWARANLRRLAATQPVTLRTFITDCRSVVGALEYEALLRDMVAVAQAEARSRARAVAVQRALEDVVTLLDNTPAAPSLLP